MRAGESPHAWLRQALADAKATHRRSLPKHRYAMPLRKDVKVYTRDRTGRRVRAYRDASQVPQAGVDLGAMVDAA
jgi:hypothetical protein